MKAFKLFFLLLLSSTSVASFLPALKHPVNDLAHVLSVEGRDKIASEIVALKMTTGAQLGVVILDTLHEANLEETSMKIAREWKLGDKERDDGTLFLLVTQDRKMRLEVGYGLEPIVTDFKAKQMLQNIKPLLREKKYDEAVLSIISQLSALIAEHKAEINSKTEPNKPNSLFWFLTLPFLGIALVGVFLSRKKKKKEQEDYSYLTEDYSYLTKDYFERKQQKTHTNIFSTKDNDMPRTTYVAPIVYDNYSSNSDSSSGSDWSGGGGDFGGGGSSDSF